jgi:two-component system chemotaxis response regulator CheY
MNETMKVLADAPVLIIDDLLSARMILADMVKELGFKKCLQARDGEEALHMMERAPVQLVLCDFMMAGMDGLDFLKALRARNVEHIPPIIFVSALGDVQSVESALTFGATDYLVKPVNFRKLRSKIERALHGTQQAYGV